MLEVKTVGPKQRKSEHKWTINWSGMGAHGKTVLGSPERGAFSFKNKPKMEEIGRELVEELQSQPEGRHFKECRITDDAAAARARQPRAPSE